MKPIEINELLDIVKYEKVRTDYRKEIIEYKKNRRFFLGPQISMTFENRKTMKFQIQEMMRAERMIHDEPIQSEIEVYNTLIPADNELSATLFIEITEEEKIKEDLHKFLGLTDGEKLWIQIGDHKIFAKFEEGRSEEDKISSVHYIRFTFNDEELNLFKQFSIPASIMISQNDYRFYSELTKEARQTLINDLDGMGE